MTHSDNTFPELFKKYRLRSEIETLSEFGDLLAQEGIVYETSLFSKWQNGERIPKERNVILTMIKLFIKLGGMQSITEGNQFIDSLNQNSLSQQEIDKISHWFYSTTDIKKVRQEVFFFSSPIYPEVDKYTNIIYNEISKQGYTNVCHEVIDHTMRELIAGIEAGIISKTDEYKKEVENLIERIKRADICIFETTSKSIGTGYLIHQAFAYLKPTILLYLKERRPNIFSVIPNERLMMKSYNEINIRKVVKGILNASSHNNKNIV